jgi:hypothetical protein
MHMLDFQIIYHEVTQELHCPTIKTQKWLCASNGFDIDPILGRS